MITQIEVSLNPRRFTRNGRRPLLVFSLLLCLQCAPSANAQTMSDQLQFVMAGRKALLAGSDDKLKLVEPPRPEIQNTREITTLELGTPIERELAGGQEHDYQITLAEGQYAFVVVEQRGIDVVVQLLGPDGKSITESDFETRNQGTEKIEVVAEAAGRYRLLVKAKYPKLPTGRYEIRFSEVRNATEKDRSLEEARRYQAESWRVSDSGKYTEALALAEKALELEERAKGSEHPDLAAFLISIAIKLPWPVQTRERKQPSDRRTPKSRPAQSAPPPG